jgi:hypothetical protein
MQVAPIVVPPKSADVVTTELYYDRERPDTLPARAADDMQLLLELRITIASADGTKVQRDTRLARFAPGGNARWEPAMKDLADAGGSYAIAVIDPPSLRDAFRRRGGQAT